MLVKKELRFSIVRCRVAALALSAARSLSFAVVTLLYSSVAARCLK